MSLKWPLLLVLVVHSSVIMLLLHVVHYIQPTPLIDEVFHVRQTQHYCRGDFHPWDEKITTLPGLYMVAVAILSLVSWCLGVSEPPCSLFALRAVSAVFSCVTPAVLYAISCAVNQTTDEWYHALTALTLSLFPLLYTFSFLYYTDVVSTVCVLAMYACYLHGHRKCSALAGILSVFVRQTNIVWVMFVTALITANCVIDTTVGKSSRNLQSVDQSPIHSLLDVWTLLTLLLRRGSHHWLRILSTVLRRVVWHVLVLCLFAAFVVWNGAIVVGDRSAHTVHVRPEQLVYFLFVSAPFLSTNFVVALIERRWRPLLRPLTVCLACSALGILCLLRSSTPHPYLLADNRHIAFYLWRRILAPAVHGPRSWLVLAPCTTLMTASLLTLWWRVRRRGILLRLGLVIASCLLMCTSSLLELRYFITPFVMARVHFDTGGAYSTSRRVVVLLEMVLYVAVNAAMLLLFWQRAFTWHDQPGLQRIIW